MPRSQPGFGMITNSMKRRELPPKGDSESPKVFSGSEQEMLSAVRSELLPHSGA